MTHRRHRIAWTVSLIGHAAMVALFFALFPLWKSPEGDGHDIETRVDTTVVNLHLDEAAVAVAALPEAPSPVRPLEPSKPIKKTGVGVAAAPLMAKKELVAAVAPGMGEKKPQTLALHGKLDVENYSVVYVLDRSGSMGRAGKLDKARSLVKASLRQLTPQVKFQIVAYDRAAEVFAFHNRTGLTQASCENIELAEAQLDQLNAEGSSRHLEGLRTGLRYQPQLLILLTDSEDLSPADAVQVRQWNDRQQTIIHAVILNAGTTEHDFSLLRKICHPGDGVHFLP